MPDTAPPPRRLLLLRHAKAVPHVDDDTDHARPLAPRGHEQLAALSDRLRPLDLAPDLAPDLALVSDAARTRETWSLIAPAFPGAPGPDPLAASALYLAEAAALLALLRRLPAGVRSPILVGHNPGLHALALALAGPDRAAATGLAGGLPTATLVSLDLSDAPWSTLGPARVTGCTVLRP